MRGHRVPPRTAPRPWVSPGTAQRDLGLIEPGELSALRALGEPRRVAAGTVVAAAGSTVRAVQVVADGELELRARLASGRTTMAVVRTGGVIADIPLLLGNPMPFDAVASRATDLVVLSRETWMQLLGSSPGLALRWMTSIARRLDDDRRRLVVVTSRPLEAQVAFLLLDLAEGRAGERAVRLSHTTLASLLGARRQSVTRVLGELRARGLVDTGYGAVRLLDEDGLRAVRGAEPLPG